jgi:hypothetical protein
MVSEHVAGLPLSEHETEVATPFLTNVIVPVGFDTDFTRRFLNVPARCMGVPATAALVNVSAEDCMM